MTGVDATVTPCPDTTVDIPLPVLADTWLDATPQGGAPTLYGGSGSHILLTVDTLGYAIESVTLTLQATLVATACDPDGLGVCRTCARQGGAFDVYLSRTDWDEAAATTNARTATEIWEAAGATGAGDRKSPLPAVYSTTTNLLVHTRTFLPPDFFSPTNRLGFHLEAAGGQAHFFSKEDVSSCDGEAVPPRVTIRCR